jgi:signal transduction histidine kinase
MDEALDELRRSTSALAPPALEDLGLHGAIERHCGAIARAAGLEVSCEVPSALPLLSRELEIACYRIVQECLHNTVRHAGAHSAKVRLAASPGTLELEVADDGAGLGADAESGAGLTSIQERARLLGGSASFSERPGGGARVVVSFPLSGGSAA